MDLWDLAKNISKFEKRMESSFEKFFNEGKNNEYGFCADIYDDIEKIIFESYGLSRKDSNFIYPDFMPVIEFISGEITKREAIREMKGLQKDLPRDMKLMRKRLEELNAKGKYKGLSKSDWEKLADEIGRSVGDLITFPDNTKDAKEQSNRKL